VIACLHGTQKGNGTPKILPSESLPHPPASRAWESLVTSPVPCRLLKEVYERKSPKKIYKKIGM